MKFQRIATMAVLAAALIASACANTVGGIKQDSKNAGRAAVKTGQAVVN